MDRGLAGLGFYGGLLIGFVAGVAFQLARRAWVDLRKTRALVPGLKKTAWGFTRPAAGWIAAIVVLAVVVFAWLTAPPTP